MITIVTLFKILKKLIQQKTTLYRTSAFLIKTIIHSYFNLVKSKLCELFERQTCLINFIAN